MAALCNSASRNTLKEVDLSYGTCDFEEKKGCKLVADLIAHAQALKKFDIDGARNSVIIEAVWATADFGSGIIIVMPQDKSWSYEVDTDKNLERAVFF